MNSPPATIFIVDDDAAVRKGLARLLAANGMHPLTFSRASELLAQPEPKGAACVVLDLQLPDLNGLRVQEEVATRRCLPVIFVTGHGDVPVSVRAMKAGAVDFLQKPVSEDKLLAAVHEALRRHDEQRRRRDELAAVRSRYVRLTTREREVMQGVVAGRLNKQIAGDLGTTEKTIKVHRGRVMQKMEVTSVADLVRAAARLAEGPATVAAAPHAGPAANTEVPAGPDATHGRLRR